ncbi:MAG: phosphoribosylanthranilate isomerase [Gammaproteobacteria bacterium]|nr:phosphoribosylanthranilate isomerase [Gammaproteobacteria bacterium]NNF50197.1 phosphoribosylanthranilate isomerase [Woeseiaceae bacterium]MBT8093182.1 phosphoribosylanthranilate isomerase [Gammaproteobacteria bacterium]MBT8104173.1 phosphoribosylanthranilate isomerase [Gammaproteobacteria bacterium]NNK24188.1 phosphoribosylanthranilate isomerase [Woeseiaceae bacterium]
MLVKICGLGSAEQVRAAVDAGADAVGFVFAESVRRVTPEQAARFAADVPHGIRRVAVMLHPTNTEWQAVLHGFNPDVLQSDAEDFANLDVPESIERWSVYREGNKVTDTSVRVTDTVFLYEGAKSGQGETVDWDKAAVLARKGNMILAGGLSVENVGEAVMTVKPYGVDVSSAVESAPGQKDPRLIEQFIQAARAAEQQL